MNGPRAAWTAAHAHGARGRRGLRRAADADGANHLSRRQRFTIHTALPINFIFRFLLLNVRLLHGLRTGVATCCFHLLFHAHNAFVLCATMTYATFVAFAGVVPPAICRFANVTFRRCDAWWNTSRHLRSFRYVSSHYRLLPDVIPLLTCVVHTFEPAGRIIFRCLYFRVFLVYRRRRPFAAVSALWVRVGLHSLLSALAAYPSTSKRKKEERKKEEEEREERERPSTITTPPAF